MMEALISKESGIASAAAKMPTFREGVCSQYGMCALGSNVFED